jgi:pyridinium-3,5-biscarboxylic acid mononucleotide synthase
MAEPRLADGVVPAPGERPDGILDGVAHLDLERTARRGYPEAVFAEGKSVAQLVAIAREYARLHAAGTLDAPVLFTRVDAEKAAALAEVLPDALVDDVARMVVFPAEEPPATGGEVAVVCAGTSDVPVAREAMLTARYLGRPVSLTTDVGVAGIHRLQARLPDLRRAACLVVAAGMDGALPTVLAGQVSAPVVALPTSVGYGASFQGVAPLLTMLTACAPGIGVVNIDNGYGAGHLAAQVARWAPAPVPAESDDNPRT